MVTQDIALGSAVHCRDGIGGRVARLVVDPDDKRLTHLVVARGTGLADVVVPIKHLKHVEHEAPVLDLSVDDLAGFPHFAEVDYALPGPEWIERHGYLPDPTHVAPVSTAAFPVPLVPSWAGLLVREHTHAGLSSVQVPLGRGTRIALGEQTVGRLDHVLLDPHTEAVRALVVRRDHLGHRDVIVPVEWVQAVTEEEVLLDADRAALVQAPEYRPARSDEEISAAVRAELAAHPHTRGKGSIGVYTEAGVVRLRGAVGTEEARQAASRVAAALPHVWEVDNGVLVESAVVAAVDEALAHDARTARAAIDVTCQGDGLTLSGRVRTEVERDAALEVARGVTGVTVVLDELEVRPDAARRLWPEPDADTLMAAASAMAATQRH